jgi:hypothetical protein
MSAQPLGISCAADEHCLWGENYKLVLALTKLLEQ